MSSQTSKDLVDLFLSFAPINSVSLSERPIADAVIACLVSAGIRVVEDDSARTFGGTTGNLLCFPPQYQPYRPAFILTSHLDTVYPTTGLKPVIHSDRITSDGTTILGADNRMGLSILVYLLRRVASSSSAFNNFFVLLTVGEETGLFGSAAVDLAKHGVTGAFVFDCSRRPGAYIREATGLHSFRAEVHGRGAHSGVNPEDGVSAISLASAAITRMRLGRIDAETTANVGKISGGNATNAIPEKVILEGEVRSFHAARIREELHHIHQALLDSTNGSGKVLFTSSVEFEPYILSPTEPIVVELERVLRAIGLNPEPIRYGGGSDANKYNAKGMPAVDIGIGAQKPHSHEEYLLLEDIDKSYEIAYELVRAL
jgi:tripeptide aminopeptidase